MSKFSVFVDTTSVAFVKQLHAGGNILSNFHIRLDKRPFPSDPWLDFPIIVLAWWLDGFALLRNTGEPVENSFMNGPFEFLTKSVDVNIKITCHRRGLNETVQIGAPFVMNVEEYKSALVQAGERLAKAVPNDISRAIDATNLRLALERVRTS